MWPYRSILHNLRSCACVQVGESINDLNLAEEEARKGHTGIWMYGDPGSESDEEETPQPSAWGR